MLLLVIFVLDFYKPCHEQAEIRYEILIYGAQGEPYYCGKVIDDDLKELNEMFMKMASGKGEKNCNGK